MEAFVAMKFMLCLDGSQLSESAIPICKKLAEAAQAEVQLVRVIEHDHVNAGEAYSGNITLSAEEREQLEGEDRRVLRRLDEVASGFSTPTSTHLLHGREPAKALIQEASENRADLVVMATHSRGAAGEAVFGSVAKEVTHSGVAPVLMVHPVRAPAPKNLPIGSYVFTSDGKDLGVLRAVTERQIKVEDASGKTLWLDAADVANIEAGRILLQYDASDLPKHFSSAVRS